MKKAIGLPEEHINPALLELASSRKKGFFSRLFSRSSSREKYAVGSPAWAAFHSARLRNPIVKDITDIQPWYYYDRITAAQGTSPAAQLLWFQTPIGQSSKTQLDTNMKLGGQLAPPKHMLVMALRFIFTDMFPVDIELMTTSYFVEFQIGDKNYAEGHFDLFPGGAGIYGAISSALASPAAASISSNGMPDPNTTNNWGMDRAIHLLSGQTFVVKATAPTAVTLAASSAAVGGYKQQGRGLNLRAVIDGILYREVQ